jgi:hypothetical protein
MLRFARVITAIIFYLVTLGGGGERPAWIGPRAQEIHTVVRRKMDITE